MGPCNLIAETSIANSIVTSFECNTLPWSAQMDWKRLRPWILPTTESVGSSAPSLAAGLRHYAKHRDGAHVRYHLRIEHSGQSLLIVAASEAVRLTQSGTIAAVGILEGQTDAEIVSALQNHPQADQIVKKVHSLVDHLGLPNKRYPIFNLADPSGSDVPQGLIAPFQADVELPEQADRVQTILDSLWNAGIPHVRFVGLDSHKQHDNARFKTLCRAVEYAEDIGMIAGVRMQASELMQSTDGNRSAVDRLAELGLDYVVVPWGVTQAFHDKLYCAEDYHAIDQLARKAERWEFPVVFETGLIYETVDQFELHLDQAIDRGQRYFELFPIALRPNQVIDDQNMATQLTPYQAQHMRQLASWVEDLADNRRAQIVWLAPHACLGSINSEAIIKMLRTGPRAGADISIRVDGDGRVYAPRGPKTSVGVIDRDPWQAIWNHDCFRTFRNMVSRNDHCDLCPMLTTCAVNCPADPAGWAIED